MPKIGKFNPLSLLTNKLKPKTEEPKMRKPGSGRFQGVMSPFKSMNKLNQNFSPFGNIMKKRGK
tara:strand:+ start:2106 stop:2297 length:192 start_codon:yes stop_codon:yes gene_type:complete